MCFSANLILSTLFLPIGARSSALQPPWEWRLQHGMFSAREIFYIPVSGFSVSGFYSSSIGAARRFCDCRMSACVRCGHGSGFPRVSLRECAAGVCALWQMLAAALQWKQLESFVFCSSYP